MVYFPSDHIMCVNYLRDLVWTKFKSISPFQLNYALSMSTGSATSCVSTPSATEGLYYVSGMSFRKNITEGKSGLPVILELTIVNKTTCEPIPGAIVEIWHCDALGIYSHYEEASNNVQNPQTDDTTYLRGKQYANSSGIATIETIYPGWYVSRDTHIHMKIFNGEKEVLTSQLFFSDTLSDQIGLLSPYSSHNIERTRLDEDTVYSDDDIMLSVTYMQSSLEGGLIAQGTVVVDYGSSTGSSNDTSSKETENSSSEISGASRLLPSSFIVATFVVAMVLNYCF
ncbi:Protocatechuate 3,4-dioxygenase beta chain [compost metagenome]